MPPRPRTPSPDEAALLTVYLDAERYLLETVRDEVRDVADLAQAGADVDARRAVGARRVREAVEQVVRGLERGAPARVERIVGAAAEQGVDEAVRQLREVTGDGGLADYGDTINRGALDRLAASTVALLSQAHTSILRTTVDAFRDAVARTVSGVLVGAQTRREAAQRALWSLADRGVTSFVDRAGRRWRLSSYVEMATRTAAARAHVDAQLDRLAAAGHEFVQVSDAPRECPLCAPWEGRVLVQGDGPTGRIEAEHAIEDGRTVVVDVAGTVAQARAAGLLHPNCRHSLSLYLPGVTPAMRPAAERADPDGYNAGQRQREIERHIRAWKNRAAAAIDEPGRRHAEQYVRAWQSRMRAHLTEHPGLKRLRYREAPGAGNLPTVGLRERVGTGGPTPQLVRPRERTPRQMTDPELERRMRVALAREDFDEFDRIANETDRRDQARAQARERRAAEREAREQAQAEEFDRLLAQGTDEETAVESAYGVSVERQRRQRAISQLRASGYTGRSFDELSREAFRDHVWQLYSEADVATNGYMTNPEATRRGVDPLSLFTGPEHVAYANASDELLEWWEINGRPTLAEFRATLLGGDPGDSRSEPAHVDESDEVQPTRRASLDEWADDVDRIAAIRLDDGRDDRLAEVWRVQGYDAFPRVVSPDEFEQLSDDHHVLYRGIAGANAAQWAEDIRSGEWFPGLGAYGNGAYTATDKMIAAGYATGRGWRGAEEDGVIVRMALPPDARTITLEDLRRLAGRDARLEERPFGPAFGDPGRLAAALGYDALVFTPDPSTPEEQYVVVLNRGALIVDSRSEAP